MNLYDLLVKYANYGSQYLGYNDTEIVEIGDSTEFR